MPSKAESTRRCYEERDNLRAENRALKRLIAELTVPIRNEAVTPELLKAWREKAAPFLGGKIVVQ